MVHNIYIYTLNFSLMLTTAESKSGPHIAWNTNMKTAKIRSLFSLLILFFLFKSSSLPPPSFSCLLLQQEYLCPLNRFV